jgi:hypothetical protein
LTVVSAVRPVASIVLFIVAALLLTSFGGAGIVASPVTLPLMYLVVRSTPTRGWRRAGVIIGGLTAFEAGWGLGYVLGYDGSAALIVALVVTVLAVFAFATAGSRRNARLPVHARP